MDLGVRIEDQSPLSSNHTCKCNTLTDPWVTVQKACPCRSNTPASATIKLPLACKTPSSPSTRPGRHIYPFTHNVRPKEYTSRTHTPAALPLYFKGGPPCQARAAACGRLLTRTLNMCGPSQNAPRPAPAPCMHANHSLLKRGAQMQVAVVPGQGRVRVWVCLP